MHSSARFFLIPVTLEFTICSVGDKIVETILYKRAEKEHDYEKGTGVISLR